MRCQHALAMAKHATRIKMISNIMSSGAQRHTTFTGRSAVCKGGFLEWVAGKLTNLDPRPSTLAPSPSPRP
eukprot:2247568-Rhodomonas_salina.2